MSEGRLQKQIKDYMVEQGAYIETIFGGGYQAAGVPDLLACYKGRFIAIEVKSPNGKGVASDIQKLKILEIRKAGGIAFFADSMDDVNDVLDQFYDDEIKYAKDTKYI